MLAVVTLGMMSLHAFRAGAPERALREKQRP